MTKNASSTTDQVVLQTLLRGLTVLDFVARSNGLATAKLISQELGLRTATCYHLLRTLLSEGYIVRSGGGTYDVGPQGGRLGHHLEKRFGPSPEISALLTRLHNRTHETAYVSGWNQGAIVMKQFIGGSGPVSVGKLDVGYGANMHARASCLSVLAYLPADLVGTMMFGTEMAPLTPQTITTFDGLLARLKKVKRAGYAVDNEEFLDGVCCIAAPFFDIDEKPVGSFTVSVAASRFAAQRASLATAVIEVAALATRLLQTGRVLGPEQIAAQAAADGVESPYAPSGGAVAS